MSARLKGRARKAQVFGGILSGVIVILFAGHLLPGFVDTAPAPLASASLTCPPDCPEGIGEPQEITEHENQTSTITFDPNPIITSKSDFLTQLADNVDSPIVPQSPNIVLTAITTLEDSVGNQLISAQQTVFEPQALVSTGEELQTLNGGVIRLNMLVETDFPEMTYSVSGKIINHDRSIEIDISDSGTTDADGDFEIRFEQSNTLNQRISGGDLVYSFSMQDMSFVIGGMNFGFDGVQQIYRLDVTVDAGGFIRFASDSTEPIRTLPKDNTLTFSSVINEQFTTITCLVMSSMLPDCIDEESGENVMEYPAPSISSIAVLGGEGILGGPLNSGESIVLEINRNSNYTINVGQPLNLEFSIQTPTSQKDYLYKCWNEQMYLEEFTAITNGTLKTRTLDGNTLLTCDFPPLIAPDAPTG